MSEEQMKLVVRRTFAASVERVYEAWTDPAAIRRWFCPGDMTVPEAEADVDVTAETVQTDAAAEAPEKTAQEQPEQSPDNKEVSDDDAAQKQEEA